MEIPKEGMLPIGTMLCQGKYRIEKYLSSGGFGNTYLATNVFFNDKVAIKEHYIKGVCARKDDSRTVSVSVSDNVNLFENLRAKFTKEAQRIHKISNEHIVRVHDFFDENGTSYYVMDYIEGESLSARMKRIGRALAEDELMPVLTQVLDALQVVHSNGLLHLDLKPGNIMIDADNNIKLIDFGASKQAKGSDGHTLTLTSGIAYTPGYAPTEQMEQKTDSFGAWTDLYSLGATMYNLLTRQSPPSATEIFQGADVAFSFPTGVSKKLKELIVWLMSINVRKRPQSVADVVAFLNKKGVSGGSKNNIESQPAKKTKDIEVVSIVEKPVKPKSNVWKYVLAALVCCGLAGAFTLFQNSGGNVTPAIGKDTISDVSEVIIEEPDNYENGHEYVDLGLSVKWATCNVGADSPRDYGDYFAWGETSPKEKYEWSNLKYCSGTTPGGPFTKYVAESDYGVVDNKTSLDLSDDAAHVNWGGSWRMPTKEELDELIEKCTGAWTSLDGAQGYKLTSKTNGNSIFLPAAGWYSWDGDLDEDGSEGHYLSSSIHIGFDELAYSFGFGSGYTSRGGNFRRFGQSVRPVCP